MLDEVYEHKLISKKAENFSIFSLDNSYEDALVQNQEAKKEWDSSPPATRENLLSFKLSKNIPNIKDDTLLTSKNTFLLRNEIKARLSREDPIVPFGLETLNFDSAVMEIAESIENIKEIRKLYQIRKATVGDKENSGIDASEARKLKHCFTQGRELFLASRNGSLMAKPLNLFYALTAYSYGTIILNNPLRYRKDMLPGSHGMTYSSLQTLQFGGDSPKGTFSDLICAFPTQTFNSNNISFNIDCFQSIIEFYQTKFEISIGSLMSIIPEMSEYYKLSTGNQSRCFPLSIFNQTDQRGFNWELHIGNGEVRPTEEGIANAFNGFSVTERHGKIIVTIPPSQMSNVKALIYTDIRGGLWFIDNPFFPVMFPEMAVHFLICGAFSNIMRYRPDEWGELLLNEVDTKVSLLTRHYFSSLERKFMVIVMRSISRYNLFAI